MTTTMRAALAACLIAALSGCGGGLDAGTTSDTGAAADKSKQSVTVGSANFPENALLAEIYVGALRAAGLTVDTKLNIGSREVLFPAMKKGQIDLVPEYTGSLLAFVSTGKPGGTGTASQVTELNAELPATLTLLAPSQAQDQNTVTCTPEIVEKYSLKTLDDLAEVSRNLTIGGPPELATRDGFGSLASLNRLYGVVFKRFRPLDAAGPLSVSALKAGKVDCANLFSTQSAIAANGFITLQDPKGYAQSEAVIPLATKDAATPAVRQALDGVSAQLTTANLKDMVKRIEVDKDDTATVAADFLEAHHLS
jgi:osmoprotectant transport system substrate-binding protein